MKHKTYTFLSEIHAEGFLARIHGYLLSQNPYSEDEGNPLGCFEFWKCGYQLAETMNPDWK